jgi:hypothetical protein
MRSHYLRMICLLASPSCDFILDRHLRAICDRESYPGYQNEMHHPHLRLSG